jgi:type I restriction enzyme S subunit
MAELLELQDIPPPWRWVSMTDVTNLTQYGTSVKADGDASTGVAILRMGNIQEGAIDLSDLKYIDPDAEDIARFSVRPGDILFNRTNSPELVGKAAVWDEELPAVFASYLIRIKCDAELASSSYVCSWINSPWGRSWARAVRTDGVSQSNINASKLRSMPVPLPPAAEQREIVRRIDVLFGLADTIERRIAAANLRAEGLTQSILAKAFRGELVPTEAELARREGREYEPASALLERVSQEQATTDGERRTQRSRPTKRAAQAIAEDRRRRR